MIKGGINFLSGQPGKKIPIALQVEDHGLDEGGLKKQWLLLFC